MSKRLVIIDGKSVFYRGYYAMPTLATKDGTPTGGVYGFAVMALEVVKKLKPDYVCVAWDKAKTNIRSRRELYPEYKANRKPAPPDFYVQIPILHELLEALGWPLYEIDDYEADDIMGAFAMQAGKEGIESYLVTSDLDVLQLVNSHTHIYTLKKGLSHIELFNEASFREKYGIDAHQFVDLKALKGDSSDNIPGVAGVGEKTALELIKKYETIDNVYAHLDELKPTLKAKLEKDKDMAYLSKKLVTLMVDAPIDIDLEKAKLHDGVTPEFAAMLRKLEFHSLLKKVESEVPKEEVDNLLASKELPGEKLVAAKKVPFESKDFANDKPRAVDINPKGDELWVSIDAKTFAAIPVKNLANDNSQKPSLLEDSPLTERQNAVLSVLARGPLIGHNLNRLLHALFAQGLDWPARPDGQTDGPGVIGHDTRIGAFLLNPLLRSRELSDLAEQTLDPEDAGQTIAAIWKAYDDQKVQLNELPKLYKLAIDIDFPMIYLLARMEHRGIKLNSEYLNDMGKQFATRIGEFEQKIYELAGQEFNINSPAQLGNILFEKLSLPTDGVKKGKTGYSTGATELAKLRGLHPIIDLITTYREYTKLKSTYIDALPKFADKHGRVHTTFALDVAATGRLSSHDPNLQNIPTRTELGQAIRTAFVPEKGNVFVSADYNQFELRLSAVMASDKELIESFNKNIDVHTKTAAEIYGVPLDEVTKEQRRHAKVVNFGILYGMSPHGLSIATGMTRDEAKKFIDKYFEVRKPTRQYIDDIVKKALHDGYVETILGRRRPTPDLKSSNFAVREAAKRVTMNVPIQGAEADIMKLAMLEVEKKLETFSGDGEGKKPQQLLQIHDSILVECREEYAEKVGKILKETMEGIHPLPVSLKVDISIGNNWGEL